MEYDLINYGYTKWLASIVPKDKAALEQYLGHSVSDFEYRIFLRDVAHVSHDGNATR